MGKHKKFLSLCLVLILMVVLFSGTAMAAGPAHWASDAVDKLNELYGDGTFSDEYEEAVTAGDLNDLLGETFKYPDIDGFTGLDGAGEDVAVTRGVLAHTLVKLFNLGEITGDDAEERIGAAIEICMNKGIISGYPDGTFGENDPVNHGMLAVAFYRAVNKAAGGTEENQWGLTPGAYGYEELLYFAVRSIPCGEDVYDTYFDEDVTITVNEAVYDPELGETVPEDVYYNGAEDVWNKWGDMLNDLAPDLSGIEYDIELLPDSPATADAVVEIVRQYREALTENDKSTEVFSDVPASEWFYDGIMYLFNQKIVMGYGNGNFGPYDLLTRAQMAALLLRVQGVDTSELPEPDMEEFTEVFTHPDFIVEEEECDIEEPHDHPHLDWSAPIIWEAREYYGEETDFAPNDRLTREAMAFAAVQLFEGYDEDHVNLAILDRFADKDDIGEQYKKPLAFLVSIGVLNGSPEDDGIYLNPQNTCTRAEAGVFLARVLQGLDKSKMQDYRDALDHVQNSGGDE
ncbi:MAG: S-layer protein precursor [Pelotomaculum sp. PtaU1.Bin065]|nr:MAG: S-layer protein precursor [Pelotomaculum sp. PtaU1.Bin065]